ncbi:MAG: plasmid pRiA4b ORF-3 family protein [Anaerolineae bacterium]
MHSLQSQKFKFSSEHKQVLQDLVIGESGPDTILRDFEMLLGYLRERDLPVTGAHQLPLRVLPEINASLTYPLQLGLKRPQQKSYPHIHGLYLLLRASGLTCVGGTSEKPLLLVDEAVYQVWEGLNPTERYGSLLEAWLLRGKPEIIGEYYRPLLLIPDNFEKWTYFSAAIPDEGLQIAGDHDAEHWLRYSPGWHNLGLLELFGLITVQQGPPAPGKGWQIERIYRTAVGDALLALLHTEFFGDFDNILELEGEGEVPFGVLQPVLQPYFPQWENNLSVPKWAFREGTHIFKVSLGRLWRRIAIPADQTLDALASIILNAVEFDHDHLYRFSYQNRFGALERINHPYLDEGPWTSEVLVGDVPLRIGQTMTYLYDFGDWWEFDVSLEQVDPDMVIEDSVILEAYGQPLEQYPRWDDWE